MKPLLMLQHVLVELAAVSPAAANSQVWVRRWSIAGGTITTALAAAAAARSRAWK
jgi:hypothetical protein